MIAPDDDDGVFREAVRFESGEDASDLRVHVTDARGVGLAQTPGMIGIGRGITTGFVPVIFPELSARVPARRPGRFHG